MKFHYKAQLAAALIAAAFAGTALAGPVLYTTETTDITSTPGANVAGQVLAGTQVEELERQGPRPDPRLVPCSGSHAHFGRTRKARD